MRIRLPEPKIGPRLIVCRCVTVDRFGNVQLNLHKEDLEKAGIAPGVRVEIELAAERYYAIASETFADVGIGEIVLYEDAYENVSIAISRGNAAGTFSIAPGDAVVLRADYE